MLVKMYGGTDVGRRRKTNQDDLYFDERHSFGVVADGIGGRKGGEIASKLAVSGLKQTFLDSETIRPDEVRSFLVDAIDRVNQKILRKGETSENLNGMGTTVNSIFFATDHMYLAHVGDTRTYLYDRGHLWQLTIDHNLQSFIEKGWLPAQSAGRTSKLTALVRALGLHNQCDVDIHTMKIKSGQVFITCTDGLYSMVDERIIAKIIADNMSQIEDLPWKLIQEANANGGHDNITILISHVKE